MQRFALCAKFPYQLILEYIKRSHIFIEQLRIEKPYCPTNVYCPLVQQHINQLLPTPLTTPR